MVVRIPFFLIYHLFLVFNITSQRVRCRPYSFDPDTDPIEGSEPDYFHEIPSNFQRVIYSEEPMGRLVEVPHSGGSNDYYYVDEPVEEYPNPRKPVNVIQEADCPGYFEEVVAAPPPPPPPPFRTPMQVFDDSDLC